MVDGNKTYIKEFRITQTFTVKEVYDKEVFIPDGYKFVDFRPPREGELFVPVWGMVVQKVLESDYKDDEPRVIVVKDESIVDPDLTVTLKVSDVYLTVPKIPPGFRFVRFGVPTPKELYISVNAHVVFIADRLYTSPRIIVEEIKRGVTG